MPPGPGVTATSPPALVLASGSRYRRELLGRLGLAFTCQSPDIDETALPGEAPADTALRLARSKAMAVAEGRPTALVIGSDQVAELQGRALGKPGNHEAACRQLADCSGRTVRFRTAVCIVRSRDGRRLEHVDTTEVRFRTLDPVQIDAYLRMDRPYDCAGSFKVESAGIALFESVHSTDPTALTGLPLIWVSGALARLGRPAFGAAADAPPGR